jgi:hypothetical protein
VVKLLLNSKVSSIEEISLANSGRMKSDRLDSDDGLLNTVVSNEKKTPKGGELWFGKSHEGFNCRINRENTIERTTRVFIQV